ncbi:MAG: DUF4157 domain-containing protein [Methylocella sp.]
MGTQSASVMHEPARGARRRSASAARASSPVRPFAAERESSNPAGTVMPRSIAAIPALAPQKQEEAASSARLSPPFLLQRKLAIGAVDDPLEHEADRVADQVMRMPDPELSFGAAPPQVSRKCAACEEEDEDKDKLLMKPAGGAGPAHDEAPAIVHNVLGSLGQPLDPATRDFFEPRFGRDFSHVSVHTDARAAASSRAVNALAYAAGHHLVFGEGQYRPDTSDGRRLLSHELAHVIQQGAATRVDRAGGEIHGLVAGRAVVQRQADSVADLDQAYSAAVQSSDWQTAAEKLNVFNTEDIQSRLAHLSPDQIASLHQGALDNPNVGPQSQVAQLTAPGQPPASTVPAQATTAPAAPPTPDQAPPVSPAPAPPTQAPAPQSPVADLDQAYSAAVQSGDWQTAAEKLNAFNTEDIQSRLAQLTADQVASLHQGAIDNPNVGPQSQVAQLTAPGQPPASTVPPQATTAPAAPPTPDQAPPAAPATAPSDQLTQMGDSDLISEYQRTLNLKFVIDPDYESQVQAEVFRRWHPAYSPGDVTPPADLHVVTADEFGEAKLLLVSRGVDLAKEDQVVQQALSKAVPQTAGETGGGAGAAGTTGEATTEGLIETVAEDSSLLLARLGVGVLAILSAVAIPGDVTLHKLKPEEPEQEPCPYPTGLNPLDSDDWIPMTWFKLVNNYVYPSPIEIQGSLYYRDDPAHLPLGEPLGVHPEYWPFLGKQLRLVVDEREPGKETLNTGRFRAVLARYGYVFEGTGLAGLDIDHVQDPQWDGPDAFENFWPIDATANREAGPAQNNNQKVTFCESPSGPPRLNVSLREIKDDGTGFFRYFKISEFDQGG